jgi:hypothetical protein
VCRTCCAMRARARPRRVCAARDPRRAECCRRSAALGRATGRLGGHGCPRRSMHPVGRVHLVQSSALQPAPVARHLPRIVCSIRIQATSELAMSRVGMSQRTAPWPCEGDLLMMILAIMTRMRRRWMAPGRSAHATPRASPSWRLKPGRASPRRTMGPLARPGWCAPAGVRARRRPGFGLWQRIECAKGGGCRGRPAT